MDETENRLATLEKYKSDKTSQQISYPLDQNSKKIIEELISDPTPAADFTGLVRFGGDGTDGALSISSGTTTINLGNAAVVVKNYTSIAITGTGVLAFSNAHANGTIIVLKSQGNVTITSSAVPTIDISGLGGLGGGAASTNNGIDGNTGNCNILSVCPGRAGGYSAGSGVAGVGGNSAFAFAGVANTFISFFKNTIFGCGGGGASGAAAPTGNNGGGSGGGASVANSGGIGTAGGPGGRNQNGSSGAGGNGGGCLLIECGGALNITSTLYAKGSDASSPSGTGSNGGSGGGGGGCIVILYNTLTANTGTYTVTGGAPSNGINVAGNGGPGGLGVSLVAQYKA